MLLAEKHEVVGLDTDLYRRCTFGDGIVPVPNIARDLRDVKVEDLRGFGAVLHLAGLSNDPLGNLNPDLTFEINHRASVRLAELSKEAGVRQFIFSSSCSTYGGGRRRFPDGGIRVQSRDALRTVQGLRRAGCGPAGG